MANTTSGNINVNNMFNDFQMQVPTIPEDKLKNLMDAGINLVNKLSQDEKPITSNGNNMNIQHNSQYANITGDNISGTSNIIMTPYLYYNKGTNEKFTNTLTQKNQYYNF